MYCTVAWLVSLRVWGSGLLRGYHYTKAFFMGYKRCTICAAMKELCPTCHPRFLLS